MDKCIDAYQFFSRPTLERSVENRLKRLARQARGDILKMTTLAGSGHPGGSMSSIDIYLTLYSQAGVDPNHPDAPDRDRVIISHGHTSPGVYSTLGRLGFFPVDEAVAHFRQAASPYEGHVEHGLPGIEWSSGNLGQGLSAGCGMSLASKIRGLANHVFVVMGDGEQQKGQISEARRFAAKYELANLTCIIDVNRLQISGATADVMPQNHAAEFAADGWRVIEIDGHDFADIYRALHLATHDRNRPVMILARTVMGRGVSFMENDEKWHGQALSADLLARALDELDLPNDLTRLREIRQRGTAHLPFEHRKPEEIRLTAGDPVVYSGEKKTDNRSAWGRVIEDLARLNGSRSDATPLAVFDCDLSGSVKTGGFASLRPDNFFQAGIMEHHTAVASGALSTQGVQVFWADFGIFGIDEVYNQLRINDINETNLKLICTHLGTDVGEDGKTHHGIDYLGLLRNLFHFRAVVPADPNQTDRVCRWAATQPGNCFIGMGRSKTPVILREDGTPFFDETYEFEYGRADILRPGRDAAIITMGIMAHRAVQAADDLAGEGLDVAVINVSCVKDLDTDALSYACSTGIVVTYEDHNIHTGLGSAVADYFCEVGRAPKFRKMGIRDYATSGTPGDILVLLGLDVNSLKETIRELHRQVNGSETAGEAALSGSSTGDPQGGDEQ